MPKYPAAHREWLSGRGLYRSPPQWACRPSSATVELVPDFRRQAIVTAVVAFAGTVAGAAALRATPTPFVAFIVVCGFVPIVTVAIAVLVLSVKEQSKGPYLVVSRRDGAVRLSRDGLAFAKADLAALRVVSGDWVGGARRQRKRRDAVSELQLVARTAEGPTAHLVVGWYFGDPMADALREVAAAASVPLEVVRQDDLGAAPAPYASGLRGLEER